MKSKSLSMVVFLSLWLGATQQASAGCVTGESAGYASIVPLLAGGGAILVTTIAAPLVANALDKKKHSPVGSAVILTFLASGAGVAAGYGLSTAVCEEGLHAETAIFATPGLGIAFGVLTTYLIFKYWPRNPLGLASSTSSPYIPSLAVVPTPGGAFGTLQLDF